MSIAIIGFIILTLIPICVVAWEWKKGKDWKTCGLFMMVGWLFAISQFLSALGK